MLTECLAALRQNGVLLKQDAAFPSVATLIAGEPIRGSWWGHPAGSLIFQTLAALAEHREVLFVKLVAGKDTLVHRRLWPEIYAIASGEAPWQHAGLSAKARGLREQALQAGWVEASGADAKELELRLLVRSEQFHTEAGSHARRLESWPHWAGRIDLEARRTTPAEAMAAFESILPAAKFPWRATPRAKIR